MARATAAEVQTMDKKAAAVAAALKQAEADTRHLLLIPSLFLTQAQKAALKNLEAAAERHAQWADAVHGWRGWALRGTEPDGYPYPVAFWLGIGDDILSELGVHVKAAEQGGTAAVVRNTVTQTAADLKKKAEDVGDVAGWPLKWKLAAGGAGVVLVGGVAAWLLGNVNTLLGKKAAE